MDQPEIVVLREDIHGMDVSEYAAELESRLPSSFEVAVANTPREERELIQTARVVTGLNVSEVNVREAKNLEFFACVYAGADHLPLDVLESHGVAVTTASGVHGPNVAEYAIGSILSFVRDFPRARDQSERREWRHYQVDELKDSTATIVGMGAIGEAIANRLAAFDVRTIGVRYTPDKGGPTDETVGFDTEDFHTALAETDYLLLACPLTDVTASLVGEKEFVTLPSDAFLVNVARGPVVDTEALVTALQTNGIGGAALDVTEPEPLPSDHALWTFDNVLLTPHNAGHTPKYWERLSEIVVENVTRLGDDAFLNQVV